MLGGHLDEALLAQDEFDEVVVVLFHRAAEIARHRQVHVGAELLNGGDNGVAYSLRAGIGGQIEREGVRDLAHLGGLHVVYGSAHAQVTPCGACVYAPSA